MVDPKPISSATQAALDELKKLNPAYRNRLIEQPMSDTPLFESVVDQPSMTPPKWKKRSVTQSEAWKSIQPHLGRMQEEVFLAIDDHGPCTAKKISKWLQRPINSITGRIQELRDNLGIIEEYGTEVDEETGRACTLYRVKFAHDGKGLADASLPTGEGEKTNLH